MHCLNPVHTAHRQNGIRHGLASLAVILTLSATPALAGIFGNPSTPEQALRYLGHHRHDVALVCYSVRSDGTPDPADPAITFNADQPMPLASTIKILLLAGAAREVTLGRLDPQQSVTLADWERFYLPATDGGAHPDALNELGIAVDEYGFAADPATTVTVEALVRAMIRHSDNAAADWVLERLGEDGLAATMREAGVAGQESPLPIVGQFLAWSNHERPLLTPDAIHRFARDRAAYAAETGRLQAAFLDPAWREAELAWRLAGGGSQTIWEELTPVDGLAPKGTARDYAMLMARAMTGTLISAEVSAIMREVLEWPMQLPGAEQSFEALGNKGGSLAGVLTDANYAIARVGDFTGRPRVSVLFMRRMPVLAYLSMVRTGAQQMLEIGLLFQRGWTDRVRRELGGGR